MSIRRLLHLDEPTVTDDDRDRVRALSDKTDALRIQAERAAGRSDTLSRYFLRVNDENHFADRLRRAYRGE